MRDKDLDPNYEQRTRLLVEKKSLEDSLHSLVSRQVSMTNRLKEINTTLSSFEKKVGVND